MPLPKIMMPDGTAIEMTQAEVDAKSAIRISSIDAAAPIRKESLRCAAEKRQYVLYDDNFRELLSIARTKALLGSIAVTTKAQECIDQIDIIWAEYEVRKVADSSDTNFNSFGTKAHTFDDVHLEVLGV